MLQSSAFHVEEKRQKKTVVMGPVGLLLASVLFWPNEVRSDPAKPKFDVGLRMAFDLPVLSRTARDFSYDENNNDGTHL